jgi:hypothetical protein
MGWDAMGWDGLGWDGMGWDERDEMGWVFLKRLPSYSIFDEMMALYLSMVCQGCNEKLECAGWQEQARVRSG